MEYNVETNDAPLPYPSTLTTTIVTWKSRLYQKLKLWQRSRFIAPCKRYAWIPKKLGVAPLIISRQLPTASIQTLNLHTNLIAASRMSMIETFQLEGTSIQDCLDESEHCCD